MQDKRGVVYRLPDLSLDDLSDEMVRQMTENDLDVIIYHCGRTLNATAVMEEVRLQDRWYRLHPGG